MDLIHPNQNLFDFFGIKYKEDQITFIPEKYYNITSFTNLFLKKPDIDLLNNADFLIDAIEFIENNTNNISFEITDGDVYIIDIDLMNDTYSDDKIVEVIKGTTKRNAMYDALVYASKYKNVNWK